MGDTESDIATQRSKTKAILTSLHKDWRHIKFWHRYSKMGHTESDIATQGWETHKSLASLHKDRRHQWQPQSHKSLLSTFSHVPYLDAWELPCFASVEWVQRCCTELFHAFSIDYLNGSIIHTTERLAHTTVQFNCLFKVMGHGSIQEWETQSLISLHRNGRHQWLSQSQTLLHKDGRYLRVWFSLTRMGDNSESDLTKQGWKSYY